MYCRLCGKFIDNDLDFYCEDCKRMLEHDQEKDQKNNGKQETGRAIRREGSAKEGMKKAFFSSMFAVIAFISAIIGMSFLFALLMQKGYIPDIEKATEFLAFESVGIVFTILALPCAIIGLLFAIQSIKTFQKAKKEMRVKPVATFVLGILGIILNAVSMFLIFIAFIVGIILFI